MNYSELESKFAQVEITWEETLKAESIEEIDGRWRTKSPGLRYGMRAMVRFMDTQLFTCLVFTLRGIQLDWNEKLFYTIAEEEKIKLVKGGLEELNIFLKKDKNINLNPAFYLEYILSPSFSFLYFNGLTPEKQNIIINKLTPPQSRRNDAGDSEETNEYFRIYDLMGDFVLLNLSIIEFKYLKILLNELNNNVKVIPTVKVSSQINVKINKYPKIFKNGYAVELFNFLLAEEDKPIGQSWAGKYFLLFKDEKLIKPKAKPVNFLTYLNKNIPKKIDVLDNRTGYKEDAEVDFLIEVEKKFQILNDVKRP
jgi:hypothetical protein